jgi:hypothetical protein
MQPTEGVYRSSRYVVVRQDHVKQRHRDSAFGRAFGDLFPVEIIALQMPREVCCRFILDEDVYRGNSMLFKPIRLRGSMGFEKGPPFWRSDEPERLELLKRNAEFREITHSIEHSADFGALTVCGARDIRLPADSPARDFEGNTDVIMLHRSGEDVAGRDEAALTKDLDRLARLRDLLITNPFQTELPRAPIGGNATERIAKWVIFAALIATLVGGTTWLAKQM